MKGISIPAPHRKRLLPPFPTPSLLSRRRLRLQKVLPLGELKRVCYDYLRPRVLGIPVTLILTLWLGMAKGPKAPFFRVILPNNIRLPRLQKATRLAVLPSMVCTVVAATTRLLFRLLIPHPVPEPRGMTTRSRPSWKSRLVAVRIWTTWLSIIRRWTRDGLQPRRRPNRMARQPFPRMKLVVRIFTVFRTNVVAINNAPAGPT